VNFKILPANKLFGTADSKQLKEDSIAVAALAASQERLIDFPEDLVAPAAQAQVHAYAAVPEDSSLEQASFSLEEVQKTASDSLNFLAALAAPATFVFNFPSLLLLAWQMLRDAANKTRDFSKICLGIPRGFAKTTLIKLFVLACVFFTKKKFILIVGNTEPLAVNFLSDVADMLDERNIKQTFGDWRLALTRDTQQIKQFAFRGRSIIIAAIGAGTSLRGLNLNNERPDVMIFDDIQKREDADSDLLSDALLKWMLGTAMKAASPFGCLYIFIGNMYPTPHSILKKLKRNPEWTSFVVGGILADGSSLWEDLKPISQLLAEFRSDAALGHPEIFYAEVLNDENASLNNALDLSKIPYCDFPEDELEQGNFIIIDPSGDKVNSDLCAIGLVKVYDGIPVVRKLINGRWSPGETIRLALTLAMENHCSLVVVESVQYQASLLYWFNFISEQYGISGISFEPIFPGRGSKNARIRDMYMQLCKKELQLGDAVRAIVLSEFSAWKPLRNNNVDNNLDVCAYCPKVLEQYGHLMTLRGQLISNEASLAAVVYNNTPF